MIFGAAIDKNRLEPQMNGFMSFSMKSDLEGNKIEVVTDKHRSRIL